MVSNNYRIDLVLVPATQKDLTQMQAKINQWITTGLLIKYKQTPCAEGFLFETIRIKEKE